MQTVCILENMYTLYINWNSQHRASAFVLVILQTTLSFHPFGAINNDCGKGDTNLSLFVFTAALVTVPFSASCWCSLLRRVSSLSHSMAFQGLADCLDPSLVKVFRCCVCVFFLLSDPS